MKQKVDKIVSVEMNIEDRVQALEDEVFGNRHGNCNECGGELDENGYCSYPCPNCD